MSQLNRVVVLSPHPDDAVWSLGGAIPAWRAAREVLVITLCDGEPDAVAVEQARHEPHRWRSFGDMASRRSEDRNATELLGCEYLSLSYHDAALRLNESLIQCGMSL